MRNPDLHAILRELEAREPIFHRRDLGTSREDLLNMTADDFWEIGASGKAYNRDFVIENLLEFYKKPEPDGWSCSEFSIRQLADELYQLNYILNQRDRQTRRTTLWRKNADSWQIVFHQGTIITE
ncbi:NTF2 domain-containing protein [Rhizobium phaseoli]|uniref:nuclear transport factor 2 family protein n=1 Tax=Rhizobium phaseoli TaxID=396 RepID=UPI0007EAF326|nr:DUF4440 domain-containing protein [Rhizobium phaseoli]ANL28639.1 NTF2 domain-containing protein [Rhizobium phaseoli]ANM04969.1 NTF2 domain-containing protein [Rhizobium phaseoli]